MSKYWLSDESKNFSNRTQAIIIFFSLQIGGGQDFAYCTHFERWTEQKEHNMLSVKIFAVVTAILLSLKVCNVKTQQCRGQDSIPGKMLRGFSFQKIKETKPFECYEACIHHIRCQSFNFVMSQNLCELNNCSKVLRWDDLEPDPNRYYFQVKGILQKPGKLLSHNCRLG